MSAAALLAFALGGPVPDEARLARWLDADPARVATWDARFDRAACRLDRRPMDDTTVEAWVNLQKLDAASYPARNRHVGAVPITWDNDHHRAADHWTHPVATVLHVDSHPDLGPIPIVGPTTDPNQPLAVAVWRAGARHLVWAKPPWAVLRGEHTIALDFGPAPAELLPLGARPCVDCVGFRVSRDGTDLATLAAGLPDGLASTLAADAVDRATGIAVRLDAVDLDPARIAAAVGPGPFALSLDLDTFVTNGDPALPGNPCSAGRASPTCPGGTAARLDDERALILARLRTFGATLDALRAAGATPTTIAVADSTFLPTSTCAACVSGWDFTPPEWVAWVRWRVRHLLATTWPALLTVRACPTLEHPRE